MPRILSIDYGQKRTGVAVTDPLQIIANGLETVATVDLQDWLFNYIATETVEEVVIGYPTHLDGTPTALVPTIEKLKETLLKQFPALTVSYVDERFTSYEAKQIILKSGARKKKRRDKGLVDKISAVLILQNYLESKR
jgi:putative Holliday junction resolvase